MKCQEARGLLIHYANGETSRSERELLQAHLAQCESCFQHAQSLNAVEQQVRTGLRTAADSAEPSPVAWQTLSHKLARRRGHSRGNSPLPLVWRLMGGLSATLAFAALVGAAIVAPGLRAAHTPAAITEDARPLETGTLDSLNPLVEDNSQPIDSPASTASEVDGTAVDSAQVSSSLPQRQVRALIKSEPDSFLPKLHTQGHNEPEPDSILPMNCSYCLKMR